MCSFIVYLHHSAVFSCALKFISCLREEATKEGLGSSQGTAIHVYTTTHENGFQCLRDVA